MRIIHVSTLRHHPCFSDVLFEQALNHEVILLVLNPSPQPSYRILSTSKENNVAYIHISVANDFDFSEDAPLENAFLRFLRKLNPDVVHIQLFSGVNARALLRAGALMRVQKIITLHIHSLFCLPGVCFDQGRVCPLNTLADCSCESSRSAAREKKLSLLNYNHLREKRLKEIISLADKIICCSRWQEDTIRRLAGNESKTAVLYYGITITRRRETKTDIHRDEIESAGVNWNNFVKKIERHGFGTKVSPSQVRLNTNNAVPTEKFQDIFGDDLSKCLPLRQKPLKKVRRGNRLPTFGYLGTLWEHKGIDVLLDAMKLIHHLDFQVLMGIRYDDKNSQDQVRLKSITRFSQIKIIPNYARRDLYEKFFSQIDWLVIPSVWEETGPLTLLESLYYKTPVIITNRPSMVEKTIAGVNSLVFEGAGSLRTIMQNIIENKISLPARTRTNYPVQTIKKYTSALEKIYCGK